ncbi:hypothetical protein [Cloacibacillus porcorum]|uniref:hypothetical protein n=1 Tax=Cloacibacillus porcorum TaxID=1197717 RepID=UPI0023EFDB26|nr:hypothetical protein [Cloacibacillus porcorum]MDD7649240.1 hypothetical protein [Cloacibacillus porcorum]MDY4093561.1 hypothetical protein [Cloacibacillus porcorum]
MEYAAMTIAGLMVIALISICALYSSYARHRCRIRRLEDYIARNAAKRGHEGF